MSAVTLAHARIQWVVGLGHRLLGLRAHNTLGDCTAFRIGWYKRSGHTRGLLIMINVMLIILMILHLGLMKSIQRLELV